MKPLLAGLALAVSACGQAPEGRKQSAEEVAQEMSAMKLEPGQWQATSEILSAEGLPAPIAQEMVGRKTQVSNCVTPEEAARPSASFLTAQKGSDCTYEDFSARGGRISGTISCKAGQMPGRMVMKMKGEYAAQSYDMNMDMSGSGIPGGSAMLVKARTTGRRVGECAGEGGTK
jgi:hypothetical protein